MPKLAVPIKNISTEADSARQSLAEEEMDWDDNEARPSVDYGY